MYPSPVYHSGRGHLGLCLSKAAQYLNFATFRVAIMLTIQISTCLLRRTKQQPMCSWALPKSLYFLGTMLSNSLKRSLLFRVGATIEALPFF